jgi:hypothetical protein
MKNFAKLINTDRGQVLALREQGDDGPQITISFDPGLKELSVSSVALKFSDNEKGEKSRDSAFDKLSDEDMKKIAFEAIDHTARLFNVVDE